MGNELNVVRINYGAFQITAEIRIDRMDNVAVGAVGILAAGHYDEITVACIASLCTFPLSQVTTPSAEATIR